MNELMLRSGNLLLDLQRRYASLRGHPLKLSQTEFNLLSDLMRHRGKVRLREGLLQYLGGDGEASRTASLDVYIHLLRGKIEDNPKQPKRIRTVRGIGYCFQG